MEYNIAFFFGPQQEELLRVKLQLDQSQYLRTNEFKKHRSTENMNNTKSTLSSQNSSFIPGNKVYK
jgi:hypothetical protein